MRYWETIKQKKDQDACTCTMCNATMCVHVLITITKHLTRHAMRRREQYEKIRSRCYKSAWPQHYAAMVKPLALQLRMTSAHWLSLIFFVTVLISFMIASWVWIVWKVEKVLKLEFLKFFNSTHYLRKWLSCTYRRWFTIYVKPMQWFRIYLLMLSPRTWQFCLIRDKSTWNLRKSYKGQV